MTITKRLTKGSPLTYEELDANFEQLSSDVASKANNDLSNVTALDAAALAYLKTQLVVAPGNNATYHDVTGQRPGSNAWNLNSSGFAKIVVLACEPYDATIASCQISTFKGGYYINDYRNSNGTNRFVVSILVEDMANWSYNFDTNSANSFINIYEIY